MLILSETTRQLLDPVGIAPYDRVSLSLDDDGSRFVAHFFSVIGNGFPSGRVHDFTQRVPEHHKIYQEASKPGYTFRLAGTDITALLLRANFAEEQIIFEDPEAELLYKLLLTRLTALDHNIDLVARWKSGQPITLPPTFVEHPVYPLLPYQRIPVLCGLRTDAYSLFMAPGTGKTAVSIAIACNDAIQRDYSRLYRMLIVCPKNVRMNWAKELQKFAVVPIKVTTMRGDKYKRTKQLITAFMPEGDERISAVIMSFELMTRMMDQLRCIEWDYALVDEGHNIASPGTKRTKQSFHIRDCSVKRALLTGTPIRNTPMDLWAELEFLGRGCSGFMSHENFKKFHGSWRPTDYGELFVGLQNKPMLQERLARYSFMIRLEEALPDLPKKNYDIVEVEMTEEQKDAYKQVSKDLLYEVEVELAEAATAKQRAMAVSNILTKFLRLSHITSGFTTLDAIHDLDGTVLMPKEVRYFAENPKMDMLIELLKEKAPNEKTIIWSVWLPVIEKLKERFTQEGLSFVTYYGQGMNDKERDEAELRFNSDRSVQYLIGNPTAGGVGVNLLGFPPEQASEYDTDCTHQVFYDQNWSMVTREQAEGRNNRNGTRKPSRYTDLVVPETIDEEIRARVVEKKIMSLDVTDIRAIMKTALLGVIDE
jgi:SNF2 family DNA or RNA helicase